MLDLAYWDAISAKETHIDELSNKNLEFGNGFYLNKAFKKIGWHSEHFFINDLISQLKWMKTRKVSSTFNIYTYNFFNNLHLKNYNSGSKLFAYILGLKVAKFQIDFYKPDIIWIFDPAHMPPFVLNYVTGNHKSIKIAQIAAPLPNLDWFKNYDLMLSSQGTHIETWRQRGFNAEFFPQAVSSDSCTAKEWDTRELLLSFIGSITPIHTLRLEYLELVYKKFDIKCFGPGKKFISRNSPLYSHWQNAIWGKELFNTYGNTKISLNIHGDDSPTEAANMRLLEATGCGSLLLSEYKKNIKDYFRDDEIITYNSKWDLLDKINFLIDNDTYAKEVAAAGMKRTLMSHTYDIRVWNIKEKLLSML